MSVPSSIERLEPFPNVAVELLHRISLPDAETADFRDLVEQQPYLIAELAHVAAQSGRTGDDNELLAEMAITLLVRDYMRRAFRSSEDRRYWRYMLACAVCCEQVALAGRGALIAYAGGLLHDVGRLALIATYPDRYSNLLTLADRMFAADEYFDILEHERLLFGMDHFAAGTWLAAMWKMPSWLRSIVGKFDHQATGEFAKLVATVRAGTRLAQSLGFGYLQAAPHAPIREILDQFPQAREQLRCFDDIEKRMRDNVELRFKWYGEPSTLEAR